MYEAGFGLIDPMPNESVWELCQNEVMAESDAALYDGASMEDIRGYFCRLIKGVGENQTVQVRVKVLVWLLMLRCWSCS